MHTFQITVERLSDSGWPVVVERRSPDDLVERRVDGVLKLPDNARGDLAEMELMPQPYGELLGQALFEGVVGTAFAQAREASEDRLRVLLVVEAPDLRELHWERLCAPFAAGSDWDFLALRQQAPYSLYLPSVADLRFPPIGRSDLRARPGCQPARIGKEPVAV